MNRIFGTKRAGLVGAVTVSAALLLGSLAVPAMGGPQALSAANALKTAKRALSKANQADKRSKRALREAQKVTAKTGGQGPPGASGAPGPAGPSGRDGFGSLAYVEGPGGSTFTLADYAVDAATCPPGHAPTGGSLSPSGGETGSTQVLGDFGDLAIDLDSDGFVESWAAWVYNAVGSADVIATAACAPAQSAAVAARPALRRDSRAERLREVFRER